MGASAELFDAWADLVHGSACLGCGIPGRPWCRSCSSMAANRVEPRPLDLGLPGVIGACAGEYEGWLRELIVAHKERSAWSLAAPLGALLAGAASSLADRGDWLVTECDLLLVPIPSRRRAVRIRGHDPALRMTRTAAALLRSQGLSAQAVPLLRLRLPVKDSVGLSASERRRNLGDAFAASPRARSAIGRPGASVRIVVCDDVMTTGATVREACSALALAGLPASGAVTVAAAGLRDHSSQVNS
ncbi:MAG: ComF family protein [Marmoricola sp.]